MDLGLVTYFFLFLNGLLMILGIIRICISIFLFVISIRFFQPIKEVTFAPFISNGLLTSLIEEGLVLLGVLAGNKSNVQYLKKYEYLMFALLLSKIFTIYEFGKMEARFKEDVELSVYDILYEYRLRNGPMEKVHSLQREFQCCGTIDPNFWVNGSNYELPESCCKEPHCTLDNSWKEGCVPVVKSMIRSNLLSFQYYSMYPLLEVILFITGLILIALALRTIGKTLT